MIPYSYVFYLTSALFVIAVFGILIKRNLINFIISIEIIINSALVNFAAGSYYFGYLNGVSYALLILVIAVFEAAVAIALVVFYQRITNSLDMSSLKEYRG
ncbi:MAG: NADH-quinone oxidoreductase subunit NuoK [Candidatus Parvarchaeota archaeon]|nr:NADH-quinone oxidoreductase subunit NuoK [Candidatus Parvarchaeota archaeon]MCW1301714.1 NADH-quinone oxidoreductase subunit NuoK [Candidatus Parvarchaeota archaeon]